MVEIEEFPSLLKQCRPATIIVEKVVGATNVEKEWVATNNVEKECVRMCGNV